LGIRRPRRFWRRSTEAGGRGATAAGGGGARGARVRGGAIAGPGCPPPSGGRGASPGPEFLAAGSGAAAVGGGLRRARGEILPPRRNVCPEPLPCKGCSVADAVPESATRPGIRHAATPAGPRTRTRRRWGEIRHAATLPQRRISCPAWPWRRGGYLSGSRAARPDPNPRHGMTL
jgi:hypothetical protein